MKKLLVAIAVGATAITVATACACNQDTRPENPYSLPIINVSTIQYQEGTNLDADQLKEDILEHVHISFDDHKVNASDIKLEISKNNVDLSKEGSYDVELQIVVEGITITKTVTVSVTPRNIPIFRAKQKAKLKSFTPKMEMEDTDLPDFTKDMRYYIDTQEVTNNPLLLKSVEINSDGVRWAVPGVQTVKYAITYKFDENGDEHYYEYFRDIKVNEADLPTQQEFEKYFTNARYGLECNYNEMIANSLTMPKHLMFPSGYLKDDGTKVTFDKAGYLGCDTESNPDAMNLWTNTKTVTFQKGYKTILGQFLELVQNKDDVNAANINIEALYLPETLVQIDGKNNFAGLKLKTLYLPSSLAKMEVESLRNIWGLDAIVFTSMPLTKNGLTTASIIDVLLDSYYPGQIQGYEGLELYFWFGYLMGESSDTRAVNRLKEIVVKYSWDTDKSKFINFYVNPYKL